MYANEIQNSVVGAGIHHDAPIHAVPNNHTSILLHEFSCQRIIENVLLWYEESKCAFSRRLWFYVSWWDSGSGF
jgi:hypothetical protein